MTKLALIRHGQSEWNKANRFTGWVDVKLTEQGEAEAAKAGVLLKETGVEFSSAYTSVLKRAVKTLFLSLEQMDRLWLPVTKDWRLNERHYGGLTGLNKKETAEKHGDDQVKIWRRSYDIPPPEMAVDAEHNPALDAQYSGLDVNDIPNTESLKSTLDRVQPYWEQEIAPRLNKGECLIIAAHGNSLRALVKLMFEVSNDDIVSVEIPTGNPLLLTLKEKTTMPVEARYLDQDRATDLPALP